MKCYKCKKEVELIDTEETISCDECGYHYLDKCPKCGTLYNIYGNNKLVLTEDGWNYF